MEENLSFHPERACLNPQEYVGRESLLQHAYGRLGTEDVQSFAIIGFHKEGKTSFVNYLQQPSVVKRYLGGNANEYIFLSFDLAEHQLNDESTFFEAFYSRIETELAIPNLKDLLDLNKITDWLEKNNRRLILIFDNFNLIVTNPNYRVSFYEGFRSWLSTHTHVGCVVTSPVQLLRLAIPVELAGSPFFNIFDSYALFSLSFAEATRLIYERLPEALQDREKDIIELIKQFGYSPYPLQQAGQVWVSRFEKDGELSFKQVIDDAYQACLPYYEEIYSSLTNKQLKSIATILSSGYKRKLKVDNNLIDRGWITKDRRRISARQMERFFRERMDIPPKWNLFGALKQLFSTQ
ncbi:MAG: hypothetical protein ABFS56_06420 [Pseudomonadota bacterium]